MHLYPAIQCFMRLIGSVDILPPSETAGRRQPEAIEIEGEAEQQGLAGLSGDGSAGSAAGELAFDGGEDTFDQGAFPVEVPRKVLPHLAAHSGCATAGETFSWDDAIGLQLLAAEGVIALGVELGISQNAAYRGVLMCLPQQSGQRGAVVPWRLTSRLSQDDLPLHIDHDEPLQRSVSNCAACRRNALPGG